jgi:hypothetical protein
MKNGENKFGNFPIKAHTRKILTTFGGVFQKKEEKWSEYWRISLGVKICWGSKEEGI